MLPLLLLLALALALVEVVSLHVVDTTFHAAMRTRYALRLSACMCKADPRIVVRRVLYTSRAFSRVLAIGDAVNVAQFVGASITVSPHAVLVLAIASFVVVTCCLPPGPPLVKR